MIRAGPGLRAGALAGQDADLGAGQAGPPVGVAPGRPRVRCGRRRRAGCCPTCPSAARARYGDAASWACSTTTRRTASATSVVSRRSSICRASVARLSCRAVSLMPCSSPGRPDRRLSVLRPEATVAAAGAVARAGGGVGGGVFAGKLAVVTGGGSGMGRELVRQLAEQGCSVAACDLNADTVAQRSPPRAAAPRGAGQRPCLRRGRGGAGAAVPRRGAGRARPRSRGPGLQPTPASAAARSFTAGEPGGMGAGHSPSTGSACTTAPARSCRC